jgi:hypothetical protein
MIKNPLTNRNIKIDGPTYKKIIKQGYELNGNTLVKRNYTWLCSDIIGIINEFVNDIYTIVSLRSVNKRLNSYSYRVSCVDSQLDLVRPQDIVIKLIYLHELNYGSDSDYEDDPDPDNDSDYKYRKKEVLHTLKSICITNNIPKFLDNYMYENLQRLYLACTDNYLYDHTFKYMPNLIHFDYEFEFNSHEKLTSEAFKHIPKLQYLRIAYVGNFYDDDVTDEITDKIFDYLPNLIHLNCAKMSGIHGHSNIPKSLVSLVVGNNQDDYITDSICNGSYKNLKYLVTSNYVYLPRNVLYYLPNLVLLHTNCYIYRTKLLRFIKSDPVPSYEDHYNAQINSYNGNKITYHTSEELVDNKTPIIIDDPDDNYQKMDELEPDSEETEILRNTDDDSILCRYGTKYLPYLGTFNVKNDNEPYETKMSKYVNNKYFKNVYFQDINRYVPPVVVSTHRNTRYKTLMKIGNELVTYDHDNMLVFVANYV